MKGRKNSAKKGFTLIELLVVIAIIAILSVVVILTLNPAELLRQSRDSNRISDLSVMKSAISFYMASVSSPNLASSSANCGGGSGYGCIYYSQVNVPVMAVASSGISSITGGSSTGSTARTVDAFGWIPINFNSITAGGSPIGNLPIDPVNATTSFDSFGSPLIYTYVATNTPSFKMTAHMESSKYGKGGSGDVVSTDGGSSLFTYEAGTNIAL